MRTRSGSQYPKQCIYGEKQETEQLRKNKRRDRCDKLGDEEGHKKSNNKRIKTREYGNESVWKRVRHGTGTGTGTGTESERGTDFFDGLPDDLVISILCKLGSSARSPSDFISVLLTCKRLNGVALNPLVLAKASAKSLAVRAKNWSESAHRFLKRCADSGNLEACYILGMIRFYCLENRASGVSLMAKAAMKSHSPALYSLAIIQFNGSGGTKSDKDLRAGVTLCARAAHLGHVDALRELGHCLQDGYGVRRHVSEGRRFLVQANALELASVLARHRHLPVAPLPATGVCPLLSDFGWNVPPPEPHVANRFLLEWFARESHVGEGVRLCSHVGCGRIETRKHEFRRCSVCGKANYCSRACQAMDWKRVHKIECSPAERWLFAGGDAAEVAVVAGDEV